MRWPAASESNQGENRGWQSWWCSSSEQWQQWRFADKHLAGCLSRSNHWISAQALWLASGTTRLVCFLFLFTWRTSLISAPCHLLSSLLDHPQHWSSHADHLTSSLPSSKHIFSRQLSHSSYFSTDLWNCCVYCYQESEDDARKRSILTPSCRSSGPQKTITLYESHTCYCLNLLASIWSLLTPYHSAALEDPGNA